jgi:hypothetical protein
MYGNLFLDKYRTGHLVDGRDTGIENAKAVWRENIAAHGLTRSQVARGLAACEHLKFPPSWAEFLECCEPAPDPVAAYQEAVAGLEARGKGEMGEWSHPAVYWAAAELRAELMTQTYGAVKERWMAAFKRQIGRAEWPPIPVERAALPAPGAAVTSRDQAAAALQALGASGILRRGPQVADPKLWARKILERLACGDGKVTPYAARLAREVVGRDDAELR